VTTAFLLFVGIGLLIMAYRGYRDGAIRAGSRGFRRYTPTRRDDPLAFRFFVALYLCGGFSCLTWGILVLAGIAEPLPLR
jgi:hypothetical protein